MYCFSVLLQRKKLNVDEESGSLGFGGTFSPFHVMDLLSNLNELYDDSQGQYHTDFLVMVVIEDDKRRVLGLNKG